jgi:DNA repair ATPase RecN
MNKVSIKNLLPGERFTLSTATVMTVVSVRSGAGKTVVGYTVDGDRHVNEFVRASLTTATIVSN